MAERKPPPSTPSERSFERTSEEELALLFTGLAFSVSYLDFDGKIAANRFKTFVNLAIYDLYWDFPDEQVAGWLNEEKADLPKYRRTPDYKAVKFQVEEAFEKMKALETYKEMATGAGAQRRTFFSASKMLHSKDPRAASKAMSILTDRQAAPLHQTQQTGGIVVLVSNEAQAQLIATGLAEKKLLEGDAVDVTPEGA